jgi:hypothetical protein
VLLIEIFAPRIDAFFRKNAAGFVAHHVVQRRAPCPAFFLLARFNPA